MLQRSLLSTLFPFFARGSLTNSPPWSVVRRSVVLTSRAVHPQEVGRISKRWRVRTAHSLAACLLFSFLHVADRSHEHVVIIKSPVTRNHASLRQRPVNPCGGDRDTEEPSLVSIHGESRYVLVLAMLFYDFISN